jgi:choline dehydrogenase-like flavoprotein
MNGISAGEKQPISAQRTFDYVVIGAGLAGAVIAARLSEDPDTQVLLEARPPDRHPLQACHWPSGTIVLTFF